MYCSLCGGPVAGTSIACHRHVCANHRRRWLGLRLCPRCHAKAAPSWLVLLTAGLAALAVAAWVVK